MAQIINNNDQIEQNRDNEIIEVNTNITKFLTSEERENAIANIRFIAEDEIKETGEIIIRDQKKYKKIRSISCVVVVAYFTVIVIATVASAISSHFAFDGNYINSNKGKIILKSIAGTLIGITTLLFIAGIALGIYLSHLITKNYKLIISKINTRCRIWPNARRKMDLVDTDKPIGMQMDDLDTARRVKEELKRVEKYDITLDDKYECRVKEEYNHMLEFNAKKDIIVPDLSKVPVFRFPLEILPELPEQSRDELFKI